MISYIRDYFDQNFAIYSIMKHFDGIKITSQSPSDDSTIPTICYIIDPDQDEKIENFIRKFNGTVMVIYGHTYITNITKDNNNIIIYFTQIDTTPTEVVL